MPQVEHEPARSCQNADLVDEASEEVEALRALQGASCGNEVTARQELSCAHPQKLHPVLCGLLLVRTVVLLVRSLWILSPEI